MFIYKTTTSKILTALFILIIVIFNTVNTGEIYPAPAFSQKGGMINKGEISTYLRTNDEYTSFSTFLLGFRFAKSDKIQSAFEAGAGIDVFLANYLVYFRLFNSKSDKLFIGLRLRSGFKNQKTKITFKNSKFDIDTDRTSIYTAPEFTFAIRFGERKQHALYYTTYFRFDYSSKHKKELEIFFSPIHLGYEKRYGKNEEWNFAFESGIYFPINGVPDSEWVNFPNLFNFGIYRRFDKNKPLKIRD